jgi:seryl-tRNA synthetase
VGEATGAVLAPAACYPLYPVVARRGPLAPKGGLFDLNSYCFRREPSKDPARMQMFRIREHVRIGTAEDATRSRAAWLDRGRDLIALPNSLSTSMSPTIPSSAVPAACWQRANATRS